MTEFKAILPSEDGILLRPQVRKKLKLSRQKQVSKSVSSLHSPSKRGRRKQDAAFRNRVGKRAQALRKVKIHVLIIFMRYIHTLFQVHCPCTTDMYYSIPRIVLPCFVYEVYIKSNVNENPYYCHSEQLIRLLNKQ